MMFPRKPEPTEHLLPPTAYVTPSNINPWRAARFGDARYTQAQLRVMPSYGLDPETADFVTVRSPISMREMWWPASDPTPVYLCPCPIIRGMSDGRLLVIAPAGMKKQVWPDGSITRARRLPKGVR